MTAISYFVALPFVLADDGTIVAGGPIECASAGSAILRPEVLSRMEGNVGAVAFSRTGDSDMGYSKTRWCSGNSAKCRPITPSGPERSALWRAADDGHV